jgi:hypothetical protein
MLTGKEKILVFSPLVLFLFYVIYLAGMSERPFLLRWIDGSFAFFAALVACNLLRRAVVGGEASDEGRGEDDEE